MCVWGGCFELFEPNHVAIYIFQYVIQKDRISFHVTSVNKFRKLSIPGLFLANIVYDTVLKFMSFFLFYSLFVQSPIHGWILVAIYLKFSVIWNEFVFYDNSFLQR